MKTDPDTVLAELKAASGTRAHHNLDVLHEVCREVYEAPPEGGPKDYSIATIGRKSAQRRGPALNTLYAPLGKRFRTLIDAWASWDDCSQPKRPRPPCVTTADTEILQGINDTVLRSMVGFRFAAARRQKAELETLKANTKLVIDRRPYTGASPGPPSPKLQLLGPAFDLLPTEREALLQVASKEWLGRHGLAVGPDGEVVGLNGDLVLPIGFMFALKKVADAVKIGAASEETEPS